MRQCCDLHNGPSNDCDADDAPDMLDARWSMEGTGGEGGAERALDSLAHARCEGGALSAVLICDCDDSQRNGTHSFELHRVAPESNAYLHASCCRRRHALERAPDATDCAARRPPPCCKRDARGHEYSRRIDSCATRCTTCASPSTGTVTPRSRPRQRAPPAISRLPSAASLPTCASEEIGWSWSSGISLSDSRRPRVPRHACSAVDPSSPAGCPAAASTWTLPNPWWPPLPGLVSAVKNAGGAAPVRQRPLPGARQGFRGGSASSCEHRRPCATRCNTPHSGTTRESDVFRSLHVLQTVPCPKTAVPSPDTWPQEVRLHRSNAGRRPPHGG